MTPWVFLRDVLWPLIKDIGLTGTGLWLIITQNGSAHPSSLLLGTGLALTVPSIAEHVKALLPGSGESSSSPPPQSPGAEVSPSPGKSPSRPPPSQRSSSRGGR